MKQYTFTIPDDLQPTRLIPLVRRMLPELPEWVVREAFEKRDVKMDGVRAARDAQALPGARVQLYTAYGEAQRQVPILYEDENLLVVCKPIGMSCEADAKGGKTVVEWVGEALRSRDPSAGLPLLCHRLDNQTDGLLLMAKNAEAQTAMQAAFQKRQIHKKYVCLVRGTPIPESSCLRAFLVKDAARGRVRIAARPEPHALEILTEYRVLTAGDIARLEITLHTGRTHQIRAQMAAIGHPLLGDDVYGDRAFNKAQKPKRLMLRATALGFSLEGQWAYMNEKHFQIDSDF